METLCIMHTQSFNRKLSNKCKVMMVVKKKPKKSKEAIAWFSQYMISIQL